jgi:hypothetical protein
MVRVVSILNREDLTPNINKQTWQPTKVVVDYYTHAHCNQMKIDIGRRHFLGAQPLKCDRRNTNKQRRHALIKQGAQEQRLP